MKPFKQELQAAGYDAETRDFYVLVATLLTKTFPGWTDEQLKNEPTKALSFCNFVREHTRLASLPDSLILRGLENGRKQKVRPSGFSLN